MSTDDMMPPPEVIEAMAKHCRCCPGCSNPPCDGVMAGGMCDDARCRCNDEPDYYDDQDDEARSP